MSDYMFYSVSYERVDGKSIVIEHSSGSLSGVVGSVQKKIMESDGEYVRAIINSGNSYPDLDDNISDIVVDMDGKISYNIIEPD